MSDRNVKAEDMPTYYELHMALEAIVRCIDDIPTHNRNFTEQCVYNAALHAITPKNQQARE